jgi:hypothetical protein
LSPSSRAMRDEEPDCLCFPCFEKRGIPPDQVDGIHPSQIAELSEHTDVSRREAERIAEVITGSPPKMGGGGARDPLIARIAFAPSARTRLRS